MGANAQTSVPAFVTGQVLTAQQQTEINTGIPVFADSSARDAAFSNTGEKILAEGQYAYLEDTNATQFYDGSTWQAVGVSPGLVFIQSTSSLSTSFSMNDVFSATYDNYRIIFSFTCSDQNMTMRLRAGGADNSTSNYDYQLLIGAGASATAARVTAATSWTDILGSSGASYWVIDIFNPFAASRTGASINNGYTGATSLAFRLGAFQQRQATSFDGFTISGANTMTGTCTVFGYSTS